MFKQNSINLLCSTLAILCAFYIEIGSVLFWYGGLLVIPAIAIWYQFKFALGNFILRLSIAILPWLTLCVIGLFGASNTEHDGQRSINMFFFEMPLYSVAVGTLVVIVCFLFKKATLRN
ncbi:hypothetical protein BCU94_07915 [Shewanella sp. 10N.286.52.C2]|uniref:hypothetical protein n=1 Tax=Shewanella sp. 10N.286.52.C2 TaxID=1880838 RepID=UPI000C827048|nr:hypothetical protein [Shewanella sp. 10N.286.52.C2]PMG31648.1 hypothetical protein BCU94_07915 [Shewanella sp. 10N.286.52.C2]